MSSRIRYFRLPMKICIGHSNGVCRPLLSNADFLVIRYEFKSESDPFASTNNS